MSQVIDRTVGANPTGFDMRTELNNIIGALESDNSGSSEPLNTVAYMKWLDTSDATYYYYKERNHDNTAWVTLFRYTVATKVMEAVSNGVVLEDSALVHKTGNETIAGVKTFTDGVKVQNQNVSPFSGFKNYIINGRKVINQRGLTSTDNSYNQDRWYKVGNNWYQGIEGDNNLISGKTYTLSWTGVATASYYVGTATSSTINAQSFTTIANGGNFTLTISAGQNLWIKFTSDSTGSTFNFVKLEEGSVATPFENRPYGLELSLCQRYYEKSNLNGNYVGFFGIVSTSTIISGLAPFKVEKRVQPSVSITNSDQFGVGALSTPIASNITTNGFRTIISSSLTVGRSAVCDFSASAEL